jgi:hypothetical protein
MPRGLRARQRLGSRPSLLVLAARLPMGPPLTSKRPWRTLPFPCFPRAPSLDNCPLATSSPDMRPWRRPPHNLLDAQDYTRNSNSACPPHHPARPWLSCSPGISTRPKHRAHRAVIRRVRQGASLPHHPTRHWLRCSPGVPGRHGTHSRSPIPHHRRMPPRHRPARAHRARVIGRPRTAHRWPLLVARR